MSAIADGTAVKVRATPLAKVAFVVGVLATLFDAVASYISIVATGIAEEGNFLLNKVFDFFTHELGTSTAVGFGVTMSIRAVFGVLLFVALYSISRDGKKAREKKFARVGLIVAASILVLLACYHVYGMVFLA